MRIVTWISSLSVGCILHTTSIAAPLPAQEQLQITRCLAQHIPFNYTILAQNRDFQVIDLASRKLQKLTKLADKFHCGRFMNVTDMLPTLPGATLTHKSQYLLQKPSKKMFPTRASYAIQHSDEVFEALSQVNIDKVMTTLTQLTKFRNRSATKQLGVDTANWLKNQFEQLAFDAHRQDTQTYFVKTGSYYRQPSLVTVIGKDLTTPAVVIGAHMDTLDGLMPGAGDDGSGSAGIMEMARILMNSPYKLEHPVYFIWYAAEERGLVGSQYVVQDFLDKKISVKAAIQFDMIGYRMSPNDSTMWVYKDYTDQTLTTFISKLITYYLHVPVKTATCGYGCSDHASWHDAGIPAAFPCETDFEHHNRAIHTSEDTIDKLTPEHILNFTKLGVALALELAAEKM